MYYKAIANGNWSDVSTWDGGTTLPTVGDDVYANGFTVTVNQDIEVTKISTEVCPTTSVGGGLYYTPQDRLFICDVVAGTSICVYSSNGVTHNYNRKYTVIGNVYGGSVGGATGIRAQVSNNGTATINVTGNIIAGSLAPATLIENHDSRYGVLNIIGDMISSLGHPAHYNGGFATLTVNHTGNAISIGFYVANPSILNFTGIATASSTSPAYVAYNKSSIANIDGQLININSTMAIAGFYFMYFSPSSSTAWTFYDSDNVEKPLYTADVLENPPAETDVRSGVVYGIGDAYTGTCAVPPAESVAKNVPVDDTVGELVTATTPADFIAALKADDLGKRMGKCATTEELDSTVAAFNT